MDYIANKASLLEEILKIDKEIMRLKTDTKYLKIRRNLKKLENISFGNPVVIVSSPDDLDVEVRMQRRSKEMKGFIHRYRERQQAYDEKIDQLYTQKKDLEEKLFG